MKVGDLVIGTEELYREYGEYVNQLPRKVTGKICKVYTGGHRFLVEWKTDRIRMTNGYTRKQLRLVNFNVYLNQIDK